MGTPPVGTGGSSPTNAGVRVLGPDMGPGRVSTDGAPGATGGSAGVAAAGVMGGAAVAPEPPEDRANPS